MANSNRKQSVLPRTGFIGRLHGVSDEIEDTNITLQGFTYLGNEYKEFRSAKTRKWRTKIYESVRTLTRRLKGNKRKD